MATTQNTFTGDGSNLGPFSFTFKWLESTDIKVTVAGVLKTAGTHYNLQSLNYSTKTGGQVLFTAGNAPANGAAIVIYRQTDDTDLAATFYSGSAIRAQDLNNNFVQGLYVTQESSNNATTAIGTANTALTNANTAISTANGAVTTANTASSNASAAVATANTASSNASAAVSTANTASSNATTAVNTANSAASNASTALSTANTALSTANTASSNASTALSTANTASTNASAAVSTANTASSNASSAVSTANTASSNASTALSTANTAISTANAAASAVATAILYDTVANVAAIPASPANNDAVEVVNSTGIQSFTPLSGLPSGFVGDSGLSVRLVYTSTGSTWNWIQYFPNDPETRYGDAITTLQADLNTAEADILALDSAKLDSTTAASTYQTQSGMSSYLTTTVAGTTYAPLASPTFTGTPTGPSFSVTGSAVPANGLYLPSANTIGIATNSNGRAFIDSSGRLLVGTSSSRNPSTGGSGTGQRLQVETAGSSSVFTTASIYTNSDVADLGAYLELGRSKGTSLGSTTIVASGDRLGEIRFAGTDGSSQAVNAASIAALVDGTPGTNDMPGRLTFSTTADGASSPTERLRISNTGAIGLSGANYGTSGQVLTSQGSGAAPQWATPAGGAWQFISSVTANNSASVAFTSGINSTYDVYVIAYVGVESATAGDLRVRFSTNGGSSYFAGASDYFYVTTGGGATGADHIIVGRTRSTTDNVPVCGFIYLHNASVSGKHTGVVHFSSNLDAPRFESGAGRSNSMGTGIVNAIQLFVHTSNMYGTFRLYGIKNS